MKNKLKRIVLSVLCAVCLQAPMIAYAVELPFVPAQESKTASSTVDETSAEQSSAASDSSKPTASSTITTEKSEMEDETLSSSDGSAGEKQSEIDTDIDDELPVISPDGRLVEITSSEDNDPSASSEVSNAPENSDNSLSSESGSAPENSDNSSEENDNSRMQSASHTDSSESFDPDSSSNLPIIIALICCAVVIATGVAFVIIRKVRK